MPAEAFASWTLCVSPACALFTACLSALTLPSEPARRAVERENWRVWVRRDVDARLRNMVICAYSEQCFRSIMGGFGGVCTTQVPFEPMARANSLDNDDAL